jgi:hypothetical protein
LSKETGYSAVDLIKSGELTQARIATEPHLGSYVNDEKFRDIDPVRASRTGGAADGADGGKHGTSNEQGGTVGGGDGPSADTLVNASRLDKRTGKDVTHNALDREVSVVRVHGTAYKRPIDRFVREVSEWGLHARPVQFLPAMRPQGDRVRLSVRFSFVGKRGATSEITGKVRRCLG